MAFGREVADAYITLHADSRRLKEEIRRDLRRAGAQAGDESGEAFTERFSRSMTPLARRMARDMSRSGELSGDNFGRMMRNAVRSHIDRMEADLAEAGRSGDFSGIVREMGSLNEASRHVTTSLRQMRDEGRISNETFREMQATFERFRLAEYVRENEALAAAIRKASDERAKHAKVIERTEREQVRLYIQAQREMEVELERRAVLSRRRMNSIRRSLDHLSSGFDLFGTRLHRMGRSPGMAAVTTFLSFPFRLASAGIRGVNAAMTGLPQGIDNFFEGINNLTKILPSMGLSLIETGHDLEEMGGLAGKIAPFVLRLGGGFASLGAAAGPLSLILGAVLVEMAALVTLFAASGVGALLATFVGGISAAVASLVGLAGALFVAGGSLVFFLPLVSGLIGGLVLAVKPIMDVTKVLGQFKEAMDETDPEKRAKALAEYRKELGKLSPATQSVVQALEPLIGQFDQFSAYLSEGIFKGIGEQIGNIDLSGLRGGLDGALAGVNSLITSFLGLFTNTQFLSALNENLGGMESIVGDLGRAIAGWTSGLTGLIQAATPFAEALAEKIADAAEEWGAWMLSTEGQTQLKDTFEEAWVAGGKVWTIITNIWDALTTLFGAAGAGATGGGILDSLVAKSEEFKGWIDKISQNGELEKWLADGKAFADKLSESIGFIWEKWQEIDTPENRASFNTVMGFMGSVLGAVAMVIGALDRLWEQITKVDFLFRTFMATIGSIIFPQWLQRMLTALGGVSLHLDKITGWRFPQISVPSWVTSFLSSLVTITTKLTDIRNFRMPSISLPKFPWTASGGVFAGMQTRIIGEAGPEAVVPLNRPLSQVDPSVRALSAFAQGLGGAPGVGGGEKHFHLHAPVTDPFLAAQILMDSVADDAK